MPVKALSPDYRGEMKDQFANFHGNQVVYVGWDHHLMFCAAFAYPLPPEMPFGALLSEVMPDAFGQHPEWEQIDWSKTEWLLDGKPFQPQPDLPMNQQGIGHKSLLRFHTPELKGFQGAGV
ncbi:phenol hydroxylase subunit P4 [Neptunomonas sp. XY-337]|uniref:phenol hydroxylase subunit P4 n=1 Tax=Neptunomonas sp. XY-337 TaxID=2561897 RepID=UPI0010AA978B|nr:phenol hydroxylase subunit P4 [Neptunomonas sp. XY-337]